MRPSTAIQQKINDICAVLPKRESDAFGAWLRTFRPYQLEWLLDFSKFSIILKSRQTGCSYTIAAAAVLWAALGQSTTVVSMTQITSDEVIEKAAGHCSVLSELGSTWVKPVGISASRLRFSNGAKILSVPNSNAGRSFSGNVIMDEFAYYQDPEGALEGAGGTVMGRDYKLRVISTPNGVGDLFHKIWSEPEGAGRGYTRHKTTIDDAISQGATVNMEELWSMAHGDPRVFNQMFRCSFLDGNEQYISTEMVKMACYAPDKVIPQGVAYAGIDVGKTADLTAMVILTVDRFGIAWVKQVETRKRTRFEDIDELFSLAVGFHKANKICIDASGMGAFPAEQMRKKYGSRIEPIIFSQKSKEEMATTMYKYFVDEKIKIPRDSTMLLNDVCAIKRIVTPAGNVIYDAPRTETGHADRAWALAMALRAASRPVVTRYIPGHIRF